MSQRDISYLNEIPRNDRNEIRGSPSMAETMRRIGVVGAAFRSPSSGQSAFVAARRRRRFARHICCCRRWGSLAEVLV